LEKLSNNPEVSVDTMTSAVFLHLNIDQIIRKMSMKLSITFYWNGDKLAFDIYNSTLQKLIDREKVLPFSTECITKDVVKCILNSLNNMGVQSTYYKF